jgi:hypothetical protein
MTLIEINIFTETLRVAHLNTIKESHVSVRYFTTMSVSITYRLPQELRSIFWEVTVSVILSSVYVHVSYSERFSRYSYFTV